jgi:hypothetical protein
MEEGTNTALLYFSFLNSFFMTNDLIEKYVAPRQKDDKQIKIHFKQRSTITGIFIKYNDYEELRSKNFWRIVTGLNIETWKKTKDVNLAKIFNGMEFTRLSED